MTLLRNRRHSLLAGTDVGSIIRYTVADTAARLALVLSEENNGTVARQEDDDSLWYLADYSVPTWIEVTAIGVASVTSVFGRAGDVAAVDGDYDLDELGDVVITTPTNTEVLTYNGSAWVNSAATGGGSGDMDGPDGGTVDGDLVVFDDTTGKLARAPAGGVTEAAVQANTSKVTNASHTGEVTGFGALTIADNAVTLAKMAPGTAGALIVYDGTGDPVDIGVGSASDVLTSNAGAIPSWEPAGAPGAHTLGGSSHSTDTLANLNTKVSDATLIDTGDARLSDARTPTTHGLGGSEHGTATLAGLNAKVSDATLIDTADARLSDARTPTAHTLGGSEHSTDTLANLNAKVSDATLIDTADARLSDERTADAIATTGADVNVDAAAPPTTDQVLQATSATTATWQDLAFGGNVAIEYNGAPVTSAVTLINWVTPGVTMTEPSPNEIQLNFATDGVEVKSTGPVTDGYVLTADGVGGAAWEETAAAGGDVSSTGTTSVAQEIAAYSDTGQKTIGRANVLVGAGTAGTGTRTLGTNGALVGGSIETAGGSMTATADGGITIGNINEISGTAAMTNTGDGGVVLGKAISSVGSALIDNQDGTGSLLVGLASQIGTGTATLVSSSNASIVSGMASNGGGIKSILSDGAVVHGVAIDGGVLQATSADGSLVTGYVDGGTLQATSEGCFAGGYAFDSTGALGTTIEAVFRGGIAYGLASEGGEIHAGVASIAFGEASLSGGTTSKIWTSAAGCEGSIAGGYSNPSSGAAEIYATGLGNIAWGHSGGSGNLIKATGANNCFQLGVGENTVASSLQIGDTTDGIRFNMGGVTSTVDGTFWVDGDGDVIVRTGGANVDLGVGGASGVSGGLVSAVGEIARYDATGGKSIGRSNVWTGVTTAATAGRTCHADAAFAGGWIGGDGIINAGNDGAVAIGTVNDVGAGSIPSITATGIGSVTFGHAISNDGDSNLTNSGAGSLIVGYASTFTSVNSTVNCAANGCLVQGFSNTGGTIESISNANGSLVQGSTATSGILRATTGTGVLVQGYATGSGSSIIGSGTGSMCRGFAFAGATMAAAGNGAFCNGICDGSGTAASMSASNSGSVAVGAAQSSATGTAAITSSGLGSFAGGYAHPASGTGSVVASASASFAWGEVSSSSTCSATATGAIQFGVGTNNIVAALQVGDTTDGIRLIPGGVTSTIDGSIWVDGSGNVIIRSGGADVTIA